MSYAKAKLRFIENANSLNPQENPALWNLSTGLALLTEAIEADNKAIHVKLEQSQIRGSTHPIVRFILASSLGRAKFCGTRI
ncbi:hypothetical protein YTPLAS18_38660 [Nitrospira sp.]|nr:hypothetical protein YTPLAS18_38660 [Nitrospira sp.]